MLCTSRIRWFGHVERSTGLIAGEHKSNVVERKRHCKKTWDEVQIDVSKEFGMESGDPQNWTGWRGRLRVRLVGKTQPSVEENWL